MKPSRPLLVSLLLAALFAVSAVVVVSRAAAPAGPTMGKMGTYAEILALIEQRAVPEPDMKRVIYSSIGGMLDALDPHTNFLDDDNYREMREEQKGFFYGLGIQINKRGRYQPLRVVAPMAGTPADRMGIRGGDVIVHIRDERAGADVDTLGLTIQEAVKYLRGPRGSEVEITVERPGVEEPLVFKIQRDAVRTTAVSQAYLIRPETGYIKITNFVESTTPELDAALESLKKQGAKRLVLDLSGNPGGLLDQAINVSSRFLPAGSLVVYTEGRMAGSRQDYFSAKDVPHVGWPVVVMVDRESASASEIVSGALQDHDRGIVVGETTFGKGLVQSVYPLSENTGLALTTQKYYTPVGRSIQRPYAGEESYYLEWRERDAVPKPKEDAPVFKTDTGRVVYGGGGITPDVPVQIPEYSEVVVQLLRTSAFPRFVTALPAADRKKYEAEPASILPPFTTFVLADMPELKAEEIAAAKDDILLQLRGEMALLEGGLAARERVLLEKNPVLEKALTAFPEAEKLLSQRRVLPETKTAEVLGSPAQTR